MLDYPEIIQKPMDLQTVKDKLMGGKYATYEDVFNDVQLIWDNCKLYNMMGSEIYKICERMEKMAKRQIQKFRQAHGLPTPLAQVAPNTRKSRGAKATGGGASGGAAYGGNQRSSMEESKQIDSMDANDRQSKA